MCLFTQSCPTLCDPTDCSTPGSSVHGDSPGKNTGVGCHAPLQCIFPTHKLNRSLLHCRQILYQLSYQRSSSTLSITYTSKVKNVKKRKEGTLKWKPIIQQPNTSLLQYHNVNSLSSSFCHLKPKLSYSNTRCPLKTPFTFNTDKAQIQVSSQV